MEGKKPGFFFNKFSLKSTQVKSRKIEFLDFQIEFLDFQIEFWPFQIEFWPYQIEFLQFLWSFCYLNVDFLLFLPKIWPFDQGNRMFRLFLVPKWPSKIEFWWFRNRVSWKNRVSRFFGKSSFGQNVQKKTPGLFLADWDGTSRATEGPWLGSKIITLLIMHGFRDKVHIAADN